MTSAAVIACSTPCASQPRTPTHKRRQDPGRRRRRAWSRRRRRAGRPSRPAPASRCRRGGTAGTPATQPGQGNVQPSTPACQSPADSGQSAIHWPDHLVDHDPGRVVRRRCPRGRLGDAPPAHRKDEQRRQRERQGTRRAHGSARRAPPPRPSPRSPARAAGSPTPNSVATRRLIRRRSVTLASAAIPSRAAGEAQPLGGRGLDADPVRARCPAPRRWRGRIARGVRARSSGASQTSVQSMLPTRSRGSSATRRRMLEEHRGCRRPSTAGRRAGSAGRCRPSASAPKIASVMACSPTSASEWPTSPRSCGTLHAAEHDVVARPEGVHVEPVARSARPCATSRMRAARARSLGAGDLDVVFVARNRDDVQPRGQRDLDVVGGVARMGAVRGEDRARSGSPAASARGQSPSRSSTPSTRPRRPARARRSPAGPGPRRRRRPSAASTAAISAWLTQGPRRVVDQHRGRAARRASASSPARTAAARGSPRPRRR